MTKAEKERIIKAMRERHNLGETASDGDYLQVYAALTPDQREAIAAPRGKKSADSTEPTE